MSDAREQRPRVFIRKNAEVEAITVAEAHRLAGEDFWAMPKWLIEAYDTNSVLFLNHPTRINVRGPNGWLTASNGEFLVYDGGRVSPWDAESFAERFDPKTEPIGVPR